MPRPGAAWADGSLDARLRAALEANAWRDPTAVQSQACPALAAGRDADRAEDNVDAAEAALDARRCEVEKLERELGELDEGALRSAADGGDDGAGAPAVAAPPPPVIWPPFSRASAPRPSRGPPFQPQ